MAVRRLQPGTFTFFFHSFIMHSINPYKVSQPIDIEPVTIQVYYNQ